MEITSELYAVPYYGHELTKAKVPEKNFFRVTVQ